VVYHDDIGDYSTNEPTMDGTAELSYMLSSLEKDGLNQEKQRINEVIDANGAIVKRDITKKEVFLVFTADEFGEGAEHILNVLSEKKSKASFFLTGNYLRNPSNALIIKRMISDGHFVGPHSDKHLLYMPWEKRDSLFVTNVTFSEDLRNNYRELEKRGANVPEIRYFIAPYEWYNSAIASWTANLGMKLINFTPGTGTTADYTTPDMASYRSSDVLFENLKKYETSEKTGLNGAIVLIHLGTAPERTDKLYNKLEEKIKYFSAKGYTFNKL
jgi:peptidoglycan/xylan/chitin deacetylase (PgdA/CDA1 family)